jgi:hypothetical protein
MINHCCNEAVKIKEADSNKEAESKTDSSVRLFVQY